MKKLAKTGIVSIIILYLAFSLVILSPILTLILNNSIFVVTILTFGMILTFVLASLSVVLPAKWNGIFEYMADEERPKWWFRLHTGFTYIAGVIFLGIASLSAYVPLYITSYKGSFPVVFVLTAIALFFSVMALWFANRLLGMGYRWFCKGGFLGIESFSALAYQSLEKKSTKGISYLLSSLTMFQDHLKRNQLENKELTKAIKTLRCFYVFKFEIPYADLKELAFSAERLPSIESFDDSLSKFNTCQTVDWSKNFQTIELKRRPPLEWIGAIAAIIAAFTFVPESTRTIVLGYLSHWSSDNILFVIGASLFIGTGIMVSIDLDYRYNPLREYLSNKKFGKEN